MSLWAARFYKDKDLKQLTRIAYVRATTGEDAALIAQIHMRDEEKRVELTRAVLGGSERLQPGELLNPDKAA
jgi:hypothetical protein